ncbi:hypothetical protein [Candidatus Palauibacter sp.]|uniref:hypothetical protein n=1 Tax=Candidatus Palauibacter sp. TaxID=3101350 RepID=UPI003B52FB37
MPVDSPRAQDGTFEGEIPVRIPLALLLTLKDLDTPEDPRELEEVDLSLNLRRRLGLSSVVLKQIRRYEDYDGDVGAAEVASLFELIAKRIDAPEIFASTGRRVTHEAIGRNGRVTLRFGWRLIPLGLRRILAWRRVKKIARRLSPSSEVRIAKGMHGLVIERGLPALSTAGKGGRGCEILSGIIDESFRTYRAGEGDVSHPQCEASGDDHCRWVFEATPSADPGANPSTTPD